MPIARLALLFALTVAIPTNAGEGSRMGVDAERLGAYPELLQARERQARLLRNLPAEMIRFEDTATGSRTYISGLPPGLDRHTIESAEDVDALLAALAPYLGLTRHDRFDHVLSDADDLPAGAWLLLPTPNGHLVLNQPLVLLTDPDSGRLLGIDGTIEHGARLPTEPPLPEADAIAAALRSVDQREAWAEDEHGAYPVYLVGAPTCLIWQVLLEPADGHDLPQASHGNMFFVLPDGSTIRDRAALRCPGQ